MSKLLPPHNSLPITHHITSTLEFNQQTNHSLEPIKLSRYERKHLPDC